MKLSMNHSSSGVLRLSSLRFNSASVFSPFPSVSSPSSSVHVLPIPPKLPPDDGESHGRQQDDAAGDDVGDGQEVVLTSEPGQRGQHHFLSALEGLHGEVWGGGGQG